MAGQQYLTVADELVPTADATRVFLLQRGYHLKIEKREIEHPFTPTFIAKRGHVTVIVEIFASVSGDKLQQWLRFCKSCSSDTRLLIGGPKAKFSEADIALLRANGVGLWTEEGGVVHEAFAPTDLAIRFELPPLDTLPAKVRGLLAPAYEKLNGIDWRDGFSEACLALESEARAYLRRDVLSTRIKIFDKKGKDITPTSSKISKMTLGQLTHAFKGIIKKNHVDGTIAKTLGAINPDRVRLAHKRKQKSAETRLRQTAGRNMWKIVNCLAQIVK